MILLLVICYLFVFLFPMAFKINWLVNAAHFLLKAYQYLREEVKTFQGKPIKVGYIKLMVYCCVHQQILSPQFHTKWQADKNFCLLSRGVNLWVSHDPIQFLGV